jgi:hypothetical protein
MPQKNKKPRKRKKPTTPIREFRKFKDRLHRMVDKSRMVRDGDNYRFLIDSSLIEFIFEVTARAQSEIRQKATLENAKELKSSLDEQSDDR